MAEAVTVETAIERQLIVLTIRYGQELLLRPDAPRRLSEELVTHYKSESDRGLARTTSCVVVIDSPVAGSPLVRALFELWRVVFEEKAGQLVCVGYPSDYIESLTVLGLPSLPGFSLAATKEEALYKLKF